MIFPLSWLILISFFCLNYVKLFLPTVNKFTIAIMIIIMINVKKFRGKTILQDFNEQFSKIIVFL